MVCVEYVQGMFRVGSEYVQGPKSNVHFGEGESKRGASLKTPGNEVGNSRQRTSTGPQIIAKIKVR